MPGDTPLAAGPFSPWLAEMRAAIRDGQSADVPCGGCTACCRSSQFVHIAPDEADTLAHIPAELLFPAPGLAAGHVVLGYDDEGRCPMLGERGCSIYEHRPRTCRTYDCRVFPAAATDPVDDGKLLVARQARRWRWEYPSDRDGTEHAAVRAAAAFLRGHPDLLPGADTTRLAVAAVELHELFLAAGERGPTNVVEPDPGVVRAALHRCAPGR